MDTGYGEFYRAHRSSLGMSLERLGKEVGAAKSTVRSWELGLALPQARVRSKLAALFNVDEAELGPVPPEHGARPCAAVDYADANKVPDLAATGARYPRHMDRLTLYSAVARARGQTYGDFMNATTQQERDNIWKIYETGGRT